MVVDEVTHEEVVINHEPSLDGERGELEVSRAKRLRDVEIEMTWLKKLRAEARLDIEAQMVAFGVKHYPSVKRQAIQGMLEQRKISERPVGRLVRLLRGYWRHLP